MKTEEVRRQIEDALARMDRGYPVHAENVILRLAERIQVDREAEWDAALAASRGGEWVDAIRVLGAMERWAGRHVGQVMDPRLHEYRAPLYEDPCLTLRIDMIAEGE